MCINHQHSVEIGQNLQSSITKFEYFLNWKTFCDLVIMIVIAWNNNQFSVA